MDDFNDCAQPNRALAFIVEQSCREQEQRGANSLATARAQIFPNLGDGLYARDGVAPELVFQRDEVVPQQVEYFFSVDGRRRAQSPCDPQLIRSEIYKLQINSEV